VRVIKKLMSMEGGGPFDGADLRRNSQSEVSWSAGSAFSARSSERTELA
jgi:hypothetical protein